MSKLSRREQYEKHKLYIESERLDKLVNFLENENYQEGVFDGVSGKLNVPFPPEADDLVRLHKLIRKRKCFTVLEFGGGWSTIVMADALSKNKKDWESLPQKPEIRNRFMFQLFSVDTSLDWIKRTKEQFPGHLIDYVHFQYSEVEIGTFAGQLCHYYKTLPDIVPDFIYLDGPDPKAVKGKINGLSFQECPERTVMPADLLLMESTFLPGTFIVIDGATNNARFLARHFKRNYKVEWDKEGDVTTFELAEERLGKYNLLGSDFYKCEPRLGQGMIGRPFKEFEVPEWLVAFLEYIREEIRRVEWNKRQEEFDPFEHVRGRPHQNYKTDKLEVREYNWSPENPKAATNFKWRDLEISWYKDLGREMSMNREISLVEAKIMLEECLESIRQKQFNDNAKSF